MHRLWNTLTMMVCLWTLLACGVAVGDKMGRRYARCMADANAALHRWNVSSAVGAVALSAEVMEDGLHAQLSRGEITMAEIRADYVRHCE